MIERNNILWNLPIMTLGDTEIPRENKFSNTLALWNGCNGEGNDIIKKYVIWVDNANTKG